MVNTGDRHAPPEVRPADAPSPGRLARREYRAPRLTVYGSVRELTRGAMIGPPDNSISNSHSFSGPPGQVGKS